MRVIFSASAMCAGRSQEEGKVGHEALLAIPSCGDGEACRSADSSRSSWLFGLVLIGKSGTIERLGVQLFSSLSRLLGGVCRLQEMLGKVPDDYHRGGH